MTEGGAIAPNPTLQKLPQSLGFKAEVLITVNLSLLQPWWQGLADTPA